MNLGLAIADFTWPDRREPLAQTLRQIAVTAEDVGFTRLAVMDHLWQIGPADAAEREMLDAYTTLGFLAASTARVELLALVTAAVYREPGLLAKAMTTLDVLAPAAERFERLEEALQICLQMWSGEQRSFQGRHYRLGRTLNSPQSVRRPHPPILIGGAGEKKTLRLVARYADACTSSTAMSWSASSRSSGHAIGTVRGAERLTPLELMGDLVIPIAAQF